MAATQTMMISASMTAYSTAVGPSSDSRKRRTFFAKLIMLLVPVLMLLGNVLPSQAQQAKPDRSVEEIRAVLDAIHPYLPQREVETEVDVFGSTSMDALAHGWSVGFKKFHPKAEVVVSAEGSETVFERLAKSPGSIGMLSRPVTQEDLEKLQKAGLKRPVAIMIAREALGVFVHESNPLGSVDYQDLMTLFCSGKDAELVCWNSVGVTGDLAEQPVALSWNHGIKQR